jgi:hypothetical protein
LTDTEQASQPFFSPDSRSLGFVAQGKLRKVSLDDGAVTTLTAAENVLGASWGPNEQIVFSARDKLFTIPTAGGAPRALTDLNTEARELAQGWPLVLSDGKTVVYASFDSGGITHARLGVASLESGRTRILPISGSSPIGVIGGYLVYGRESNSDIMAIPFDTLELRPTGAPVRVESPVIVDGSGARAGLSQTGSLVYQRSARYSQLVVADPGGGERTLLDELKIYRRPRMSPDGRRIVFSVESCGPCSDQSRSEQVWLYDVATGAVRQLTTGGQLNTNAEWTPDSKRVIYSSDRSGRRSIWSHLVDGGQPPELLLDIPGFINLGGPLTPDGHAHVYTVTPDTRIVGSRDNWYRQRKQVIWYRRLDGDTVPKALTSDDESQAAAPAISPDGQWLAYTSNNSGVTQVYVRRFNAPGDRYQVSTDGGLVPAWSRDGRRLFYTHDRRLLAAALSMSPQFAVTDRQVLFQLDGFEPLFVRDYDVALDDKHFLLLRIKGRWPDGQTVLVPNLLETIRKVEGRTDGTQRPTFAPNSLKFQNTFGNSD